MCCCLLRLKDILMTPLGKSSKTVFLREEQCHPEQLTAVLEGVVYLPGMKLYSDW